MTAKGVYSIEPELLAQVQQELVAYSYNETQTCQKIKELYESNQYLLDTHTAVAYLAAEEYVQNTNDKSHTVVVSTANPFKFSEAVLSALGNSTGGLSAFEMNNLLAKVTGNEIPVKIKELFNFIIDDSFKVINNKIQESSFVEGIDDIFSKLLEGRVSQGLKLNNTPILNYMTSGFHEGVTYFGGYSGTGKTTYCVPMFLLPILNAEDEEGKKHEKILIIANEQNKEVFMTIMGLAYISFVLNRHRNEFSYETKNRYVSRKHINENMLTDEEKETLIDVKEYIKEDLKNRVQFIFMPSFDPKEIEMYLLKYSRMGYKNVFIDTMKAETKGEYHLMSNLSQMLDRVSKENNLRILATVQLALHTYGRKYLDHTCIAEAKSIVEVAEVSLYFREVEISEIRSLSVQKFDYSQNKYIDVQSKIEDPKYNEKYMLLFIGKNRHGKDKKIILYRSNFDKVWFTEIGEVSGLSYDGGK